MQTLERVELVADPVSLLDNASVAALVGHGAPGTGIADHAALPVSGAVSEAAPVPSAIGLDSKQRCIADAVTRRAGKAYEDSRFFSALQASGDFGDQAFSEELVEPELFQLDVPLM